MVVINILLSASLVIAPVKTGGYENEALRNLGEQIEDLKELNPELRIKVLMTMRQKNKTSLEMETWLRGEYGQEMFAEAIRRSVIAEKSSLALKPLPDFSGRAGITQDYCAMVQELLGEV